jgi:excisionase family DNA binding protein
VNEAASHAESSARLKLLKPRDVADMMSVSVDTVYRMAQEGAIPGAGHVRGQLRIE